MSVWISEGAVSGTREEYGLDRNAVCASQSLDGTQEAVKRVKHENAAYEHSAGRKDRSVAAHCSARDVMTFTPSESLRNPKQKTGCSDLPKVGYGCIEGGESDGGLKAR